MPRTATRTPSAVRPLGAGAGGKAASRRSADATGALFDMLARVSPVGIFRTDGAGRCLYVNERWCAIAGLEAEAARGDGWAQALHPDDRARVYAEWCDAVAADRPFRSEYRFRRADGTVTWVQGEAFADRAADGRLCGHVGTVTDITERKHAEAETWRLASIVQLSSDAIVSVTADRRVASWNRGAEKLYGYSAAEMLGRTVHDTIPPQRAAEAQAMFERVMRGERVDLLETERLRKDGTIVMVALSVSPVIDPSGAIVGIASIARDITELKRAAESLHESEDRYRSLIGALDEGVVMQDASGAICMWNESAERMLGLTHEEMLGRTSHDQRCIHADGSPFPAATHPSMVALATGRSSHGVVMGVHRPDGKLTWISINARALFRAADPKPYAAVTSFVDITERKRVEAALIHAKEEAEIANRAKSAFLANMSHELRTPLTAIVGFSEMMKIEVFGTLGSDHYRGYVADIHTSGLHLLDIINDLLDLAKIEAGKMRIEEGPVAIDAVVGQVVRVMRDQAEQAGILLGVALDPALPRLRGDARALKQILLNLVSNAIKFTPQDGQVTIAARADASGLQLRVSDTGIGIAHKDIARLMQPFAQVETVEVRHHQGTGLGLALVQALTELHGGSVAIASEPGRGTTVTVSLPAARLMAADGSCPSA